MGRGNKGQSVLWVSFLFVFLFDVSLLQAVDVKLTPVLSSGLTNPTHIAVAPGESQRLYLVEQVGRILILDHGQLKKTPFLDIQNQVVSGGELGLLSIAFHPRFAENHRYFVDYTVQGDEGIQSVVEERRTDSNATREILRFDQPFTNHKGGQLAFDKSGLLYIGAGDGGSAGDPYQNGQNKDAWLGKIHRIDIDRGSPYAIPADNPFAQGGGRKEIFAYGLRNPWRFSFDRKTGALFAGDVGQDRWEEIDVVEKGKNYGWNIMEGTHCFNPGTGCDKTGLTLPIFDYGRSQGNCVIGGFVYRGSAIPDLQGVYVYGDNGSGRIWGLHYDQARGRVSQNELLYESDMPITTFGEDENGELFVASYKGKIYRIDPDPSPGRTR
jgi:glucose/arabinose dehydrogenase